MPCPAQPGADPPCTAVHRALRDGVPGHSAQLGMGHNLFPTAPAVHGFLHRALATCARTGRLHAYATAHDAHDRALAATLAGAYLGLPVEAEQVVFTSGATEGIGLVTRWLASRGLGLVLPAPCYHAFEESAHRWGATITGRYGHDGTLHATGGRARRTALVEVLPNGVTGALHTPPALPAGFRLVDVVFLAGGTRPDPHLITAAVRAALAGTLTDTAVLMTASKDLCLPGLRAGLLLSAHPSLLDSARADLRDRTACGSPLTGQLMLLYLTVLLLAEAAHDRAPTAFTHRYRWLARQYARHGVPVLPSETACRSLVDHLDAMARHMARNFGLLTRHAVGLLDTDAGLRPVAGYSLLPRLAAGAVTRRDCVAWANEIGRRLRLKLNPHLLFGGTEDSWEALYPGPARLRVNLSVPHDDLVATLGLLRVALRSGRPGPVTA
ncbi:aminotransferase class I/II-fold pyridoxal phosphate-dependent enzyme [Streptomyces niveiscabiei]|uniref:Aminotransferase class I/II-fold pyridoxal phosphate-dependent enzyme n=1 Tax=Streptomyces niveiscabiei TaxID=164115 RepID=A0ABW9HHD2_9ACTN